MPKPRRWAISLGTSLGNRQTRPHTVPNKLFQPFPGVAQGFHSCPVVRYLPKSRVAHNPKVDGSNPAPATKESKTYDSLVTPIDSQKLPIRKIMVSGARPHCDEHHLHDL